MTVHLTKNHQPFKASEVIVGVSGSIPAIGTGDDCRSMRTLFLKGGQSTLLDVFVHKAVAFTYFFLTEKV